MKGRRESDAAGHATVTDRAQTHGGVRASSSGCRATAKAARRSRDRGCNGHRIPRRVLVGGRHLRTSRAISFHEAMVKATLAASSRGKAIRLVRAKADEGSAKARPTAHGRGGGDRGVRGSIISGRRGEITPTLEELLIRKKEQFQEVRQCVSSCDPPKRSRVP